MTSKFNSAMKATFRSFDVSVRNWGLSGDVDIDLYGVIGGGWFSDVNARDFRRELASLGNVRRLNVHIHSPGGDPQEAFVIYETLRAHPAEVHTYADGLVGSAATIPYLAADVDKRHIAGNAWFMIHELTAQLYGTVSQLEGMLAVVGKHEQQIVDLYVGATSIGKEEDVRGAMSAETWYDAGAAQAAGICSVVHDEQVDMAALVTGGGLQAFNKVPAQLQAGLKSVDKDEDSNMTEITLAAVREHPEIVATLQAEVTANTQGAVDAERARIKEVLSLAVPAKWLPRLQELAVSGSTRAEAALAIQAEMEKSGVKQFELRREDAPGVVPGEGQDPALTDVGDPDQQAATMWAQNTKNVRGEFSNVAVLAAYLKGNSQGRVKLLTGSKE